MTYVWRVTVVSSSELMDCTNEDDGIRVDLIDCVIEDGALVVVDSADGIEIDDETTVVSDEVVEG